MMKQQNESLRQRWMQNPNIKDVSFANQPPSHDDNISTIMNYTDTEYRVILKPCDSHYLDLFKIPILAGTFFRNNIGNEKNFQWVVNEKTIKTLGFQSPQKAIGKIVTINGTAAPILGVVGDFHTVTLRDEIKPVAFINLWPRALKFAHISLDGYNISENLKSIQAIWQNQYPNESFEYSFLEDDLSKLYEATERNLKLTQISTLLTIGLGCLGLLGLVFFVLVQMTKEISIRKILGASFENLYFHIAKYFLKWILIANLISWPVAWWISREWLKGFAYRTSINLGVFILGSSIVLGISLLVISFQVIKSIRVNPVEALKYE